MSVDPKRRQLLALALLPDMSEFFQSLIPPPDSYAEWFRAVQTDDAVKVQQLLARGFDPNTLEAARNFKISVKGVPGVIIVNETEVSIKAASGMAFPVRVRIPAGAAPSGSNRIRFVISDSENPNVSVTEKAVFLVPK